MNKTIFVLTAITSLIAGSASAADVLYVSGSPNLEKSNAGRVIAKIIREKIPDVDIVRVDKISLQTHADLERERARIEKAKVIVFHYPVYWYQPPAPFSNYLDTIYTFGFAHNASGGLLGPRKLILSVTSGAPEKDYQPGQRMGHSMEEFQLPLRQFAKLCGLNYEGIVYSGGYNLARKVQDKDKQEKEAAEHAEKLVEKIKKALEQNG